MAFVVLAATEASAERLNLLDLIDTGSRNSSRARRQPAAKRRPVVRVEGETHATPVATNTAPVATNIVTVVTNKQPVVTNVAPVVTNVLPVVTNKPPVVTKVAPVVVAPVVTNTAQVITKPVITNVVPVVTNVAPVVTNVAPIVTNIAPVVTNTFKTTSTNIVVGKTQKLEERPARISSNKVYYDRKEGYAVFTGKVHVDAETYQLHAQKAYVFFEGTNELKRVVATGNVAITNDTKRAYGTKASYYRNTGMVVLYGDDKTTAEVRDEAKGKDQVVKGSKIKFWTTSEQVEVVDANITSPTSGGMNSLKSELKPR